MGLRVKERNSSAFQSIRNILLRQGAFEIALFFVTSVPDFAGFLGHTCAIGKQEGTRSLNWQSEL